MEPINIMINGLPGEMATTLAERVASDQKFLLIPFSIAGSNIEIQEILIANHTVKFFKLENRKEKYLKTLKVFEPFIAIDFTHPDVANQNIQFYIENQISFVMGTTEFNRQKFTPSLKNSNCLSVISSTMNKQVAGLQLMMEYLANSHPGLYKGYRFFVDEGSKSRKTDASKIHIDISSDLEKMGVKLGGKEAQKEEKMDSKEKWEKSNNSKELFNANTQYLCRLEADDGSVLFEFKQQINGRDIYIQGVFDAVVFLHNKIKKLKNRGKIYTMRDVLKTQ